MSAGSVRVYSTHESEYIKAGGSVARTVNIKTIAERAGVSPATVSRVLNTPTMVGKETRERILQVMTTLNYQPNAVARSLSTKRSHSIGVIVPGIDKHFFIELHKGIHATATKAGLDVLLYDSNRATGTVMDGFSALKRRQMDGIIFSSGYLDREYDAVISKLGIPVVLVLTESENSARIAFKVDDIAACFDAMTYLITRGHRDIAFLSGLCTDFIAGKLRYEGYCIALKHHEIPIRHELIVVADNFFYENGYAAMNELLSRNPRPQFTAVFAACDEMAIGAMRALHEAGFCVPDDVSVMGFDDVNVANMCTPRLTTVAQPFFQIGSDAVKTLINMIQKSPEQVGPGVHYLPHRVVGRESVTTVTI